MNYRTAPSFHYPARSSDNYEWDPEIVLGLTNPQRGFITCVGFAPSRGRRCQNRVAAATVSYGRSILNKLACESAYKAAASPQLENAASSFLCRRFHQGQARDVAEKWRMKLEDWAAHHEDAKPSFRQSDSDDSDTAAEDSDSDDSDDSGVSGVRGDDFDVKHEDNTKKMRSTETRLNDELLKMMEGLVRLEAEMKKQNEEMKKYNARMRERMANLDDEVKVEIKTEEDEPLIHNIEELRRWNQEEEKRRREEEEKRRREGEEEKKRQEVERKRREEEARKQKEEQERRRREEEEEEAAKVARARAFRERVRLQRERLEQQKKEKAEKETAEWRTAWERYNKMWESDCLSVANIPWPVKLGFRVEVTEANVTTFFAKAPPEELRATAKARLDLIRKELLRWHTDKVMQNLGSEVVNSSASDALNVVARVLVELMKKALGETRTRGT
ncbi:hypothetical protein F4810DRAFT_97826 [Camillea tinctor]|nr:hypothetical protein F4810DRAFT_97826 [Camillea tinctor]